MTRTSLATVGSDEVFLTDGGLETVLLFHHGRELPLFATFPMVEDAAATAWYEDYLRPHLEIAAGIDAGFVLGTLTWRASHGWGAKLGWSPARVDAANRASVAQMDAFRARLELPAPVLISGAVGSMGDGYAPSARPSADEAEAYHGRQIGVLAETPVDLVTVTTMSDVAEAVGAARAAAHHSVPCVISFTVETDGRLPTGQALLDAVAETDEATGASPAYYMVNCAHPTHVERALDATHRSMTRVQGVRANASMCSHAELDEATVLDDGDPEDFGRRMAELRRRHSSLRVLGGCCGTDVRHVAAIARAL